MKNNLYFKAIFSLFGILLFLSLIMEIDASASEQKIYDFANLLSQDEKDELEQLATEYGVVWETDFIILTTNDTEGKDIVDYMQDFYDEEALGYDKPHGNTAILTLDMKSRDVYLAGFYKAKEYLDSTRMDLIRNKITPYLTDGLYYDAFHTFLETSNEYMDIRPGVNPENILFKLWFQIIVSLALAGIVVGIMIFNTGGKVTVNDRTYIDPNNSKVVKRRDDFIRTSVTKQRIQSDNNNGGGGGGGGTTGGGHSHSGSRGSF